jgi:hypothetical protein
MKTTRVKNGLIWPAIWLASAIAVIAAGCSNSDAGARKTPLMKANAVQQEKTIKLRYYGRAEVRCTRSDPSLSAGSRRGGYVRIRSDAGKTTSSAAKSAKTLS